VEVERIEASFPCEGSLDDVRLMLLTLTTERERESEFTHPSIHSSIWMI
jgi:hypothetical protein